MSPSLAGYRPTLGRTTVCALGSRSRATAKEACSETMLHMSSPVLCAPSKPASLVFARNWEQMASVSAWGCYVSPWLNSRRVDKRMKVYSEFYAVMGRKRILDSALRVFLEEACKCFLRIGNERGLRSFRHRKRRNIELRN